MKTKFIGILICIMLMTTLFAVAKPPQKIESKSSTETKSPLYNVDVPIWKNGDQWTYQIDDISIVTQQENKSIILHLSIANVPLTVVSTTGDTYTLEYKTTINGQLTVSVDKGNGPVNISMTFTDLDISGNILVDKSTLARKEISASFTREKFSIEIEQSYIPLPSFLQKFSTKLTMNLKTSFDTPISLLKFPLNTGTSWNLKSTNATITGQIKSFYLYLINFINKIAKLFGKEFIPPEISALLPVIDIEKTLSTLGHGNVFSIPSIPDAFVCLNTENITVPAGTYDTYNITIFGGPAQCYYAPTAGNIVKIIGNLEEINPDIKNIKMELISTNYS
jgi:hypothetical protein